MNGKNAEVVITTAASFVSHFPTYKCIKNEKHFANVSDDDDDPRGKLVLFLFKRKSCSSYI